MEFSSVVNACVGLALLYALLGAIYSCVQELVSGILKVRAKSLEARLFAMLEGSAASRKGMFRDVFGFLGFVFGKTQARTPSSAPNVMVPNPNPPVNGQGLFSSGLFDLVFNGGLVKSATGGSTPSYIDPKTFSSALVSALNVISTANAARGNAGTRSSTSTVVGAFNGAMAEVKDAIELLPANSRAKAALEGVLVNAGDDIEKFKAGAEAWFDEAMDRLSGIYGRWSKSIAIVLGFLLAFALNIDTITVARSLLHGSQEQMQKLEADAQKVVKDGADALTVESAASLLVDAHYPIGRMGDWHSVFRTDPATCDAVAMPGPLKAGASADEMTAFVTAVEAARASQERRLQCMAPNGWTSLIGWILTGFAISFGSGFWISALGDFLGLRTTGPKPDASGKAGR